MDGGRLTLSRSAGKAKGCALASAGGQCCQQHAEPTSRLCCSLQTQPRGFRAGSGVALVPTAFTRFGNDGPRTGLVSRSREPPTTCGQGHPHGPSFWKALCWGQGHTAGQKRQLPRALPASSLQAWAARSSALCALSCPSPSAGAPVLQALQWPPSPTCQGPDQPHHRPHTHQPGRDSHNRAPGPRLCRPPAQHRPPRGKAEA